MAYRINFLVAFFLYGYIYICVVKTKQKNGRRNQVDLFQVERITFASLFSFLSFLFSPLLLLLTINERERKYMNKRKGNIFFFFFFFFFLSDSIIDQRSPIHSPSVIHHISPHILSRFIYTHILQMIRLAYSHFEKAR